MAEKARKSGVTFRPHFKTHQSTRIAEWFRDEGVEKITVSSADMADQFAGAGWHDITIAFPANPLEIKAYNRLSRNITLNLIIDSIELLHYLQNNLHHAVGLFVEIDCGYGRSGIPFEDQKRIDHILHSCRTSEKYHFKGFLTHAGNTYHANSKDEIRQIYNDSIHELRRLKEGFLHVFPELIISTGDTPSCSIVEDLSKADEIRPGNFVYFDLMQLELGACTFGDIAVSVACPVTGIYPKRNEILIHGGAVHLSKEYLAKNGKLFGLVVQLSENGWSQAIPGTILTSISQEHGIISTRPEFLQNIKHGDLLGIIPVHSCLTANLLKDSMRII